MAETPTPPNALPTIRPGMKINFTLESLIALIGCVVFCTMAYVKLDSFGIRLTRIELALGLHETMGPPAPTSANQHPTGANP